jgi:hypothetical protein
MHHKCLACGLLLLLGSQIVYRFFEGELDIHDLPAEHPYSTGSPYLPSSGTENYGGTVFWPSTAGPDSLEV